MANSMHIRTNQALNYTCISSMHLSEIFKHIFNPSLIIDEGNGG